MKQKRILITTCLLLLKVVFAISIYSDGTEVELRLRGRDFVRLGELGSVSGTLKMDKGEWFLLTDDNIYEIHLGDHEHREKTGIKLEEGKVAEVTGFIYAQEDAAYIDIAVCTIKLNDNKYRFREDDGTPLWQGRRRH